MVMNLQIVASKLTTLLIAVSIITDGAHFKH
jgi:hypothetical protein